MMTVCVSMLVNFFNGCVLSLIVRGVLLQVSHLFIFILVVYTLLDLGRNWLSSDECRHLEPI